jgi:hypothetical protein
MRSRITEEKAGLKSYLKEVFSRKMLHGAFFVPKYLHISKILCNFARFFESSIIENNKINK